jgi:ribosome-associated protein
MRIRRSWKQLALKAVDLALDKKATAPVLLNLSKVSSLCDYFLILSGSTRIHNQAIAKNIREGLKSEGLVPEHEHGHKTGAWVLLDYGNMVVHILTDKDRKFYNLEELWKEAGRVRIPV